MATKAQSMASNVNCVYRTVGSVGEYMEQHECCMIEPAPRNCSIQFEDICCMFFFLAQLKVIPPLSFAALHLAYGQVPK